MSFLLKVHHFMQLTLYNDIIPPVEHKVFLHNFIRQLYNENQMIVPVQ